jgi:ketosteroid isomerase-like protein
MAVALAGCSGSLTSTETGEDEARAAVESVFAAFNRHDPEAMAALYAENATMISSDYCQPLVGRDAVQEVYRGLFAEVPDVEDEVLDYYVEGDKVAVRFVSRSRLPGRAFEVTIANFFEVRDGLIVRDETIFDAQEPCQPTPVSTEAR